MIDKITPRPDSSVAAKLAESGFESTELVITDKNTYIAPFVNTEGPQYLVIEDDFPNGRPPLEKTGVRLTTRETVDLVERMKVCTCLNPLHTAMAVFGCLLGYKSIAAEMNDAAIVRLIKRIGYVEGMPVVAGKYSSRRNSSPRSSASACRTPTSRTPRSASPPTRRRSCPSATARR